MKKERLQSPLFVKIFLILFLFIISVSCQKKEAAQPVIISPPADTTTASTPIDTTPKKTFLALGDSYTIGQSVDSSDRFPAQTAALLREQNIHVSFIQYIATTGWTTINLMNAITAQQPRGPFDIVTLLIGVNDQYQTQDTTNYRDRFTSLLNTAISLAGNHKDRVFIVSIPDYGVTPFGGNDKGISEQIDQFNAINKGVTTGYQISYTDVTTISRQDANDITMIAGDGLHPSGKQYAQWAQALEPAIYNVLK